MASKKPLADRDTPLRIVRAAKKSFPGLFSALDDLRAEWKRMPDYDARCALPISAAYTWLVEEFQSKDIEAASIAAELTCCYLWQQTPVIYDFDSDLAKMLYQQADESDDTQLVPWEVLLRLPYPCVYIKAPGLKDQIDGFFVWIERDLITGILELRIQTFDAEMDATMPLSLHLIPGGTFAECLEDTRQTTRVRFREYPDEASVPKDILDAILKDWSLLILRPLQLVLYLCAANSEIDSRQETQTNKPRRTSETAKAKRDCKASDVTAYNVGVRIGASIRRADYRSHSDSTKYGTGSAKRPHSRRGHWHHYWTGPRTGERELILKWVSPTFIHADDPSSASVVQIPVES